MFFFLRSAHTAKDVVASVNTRLS